MSRYVVQRRDQAEANGNQLEVWIDLSNREPVSETNMGAL
jgi:hypothetical protein